MSIDIQTIGTFGISFSRDLDQTWFNLWRKDYGYSMDLYECVESDDPNADDEVINTAKKISFAQGEALLRGIFEEGHLEEWQARYLQTDEGPDTELNWTIDVDDTVDADMLLLSGNWKLPPNDWMQKVIAVIRTGEERFAKCFKEFP